MDAGPVGRLELAHRSARVKARAPADLIGKEVAKPGDRRLIEQRRLDRPAPAAQRATEIFLPDAERVGAEPGKHVADVAWTLRQGDPLKLAHVAEPQFAAEYREHHPVVPVPFFAGFSPVQLSGHPEVHEHRRAVCPGDQPLAVPLRIAEPVAGHRLFKTRRADTAEHAGVGYLSMFHPASGAVLS